MPLRFEIDYRAPTVAWEPLVDEVFGELTFQLPGNAQRRRVH